MNRGAEWRRWEPHIHAPGTVMNNQFKGPNAWDEYLSALENATPRIEAIAVTDYYVTDTYEEVLRHKQAGRLPDAKLIFPNVEVRLDVATSRGGFVNLHLLVSPQDPQHLVELQRLLSRLQFNVLQDRFDCTRADLIRLGKKVDQSISDDLAALKYGASQFKVNFQSLRDLFAESGWAKEHILIAVAGGASDGTSGVRDAADQTIRREIESFAHVIFASNQAQREFWLGRGALSREEVRARYRGLKPCLHGSDAHKLDDVASPFGDRFTWIKGGLEFDALRQACIDPDGRAHIGAEQPTSASPSQVISGIRVLDAPWMTTPVIPLNPGLVAIIGARGSGKTARADMIAAGCDSITDDAWSAGAWANPSFLLRARSLLGDGKVEVRWEAEEPSVRMLNGSDANGPSSYERARYLSQQFVEELCSSSGLTDGLLREVERVIFEAHPENTRDGALDFSELLDLRASRHRHARNRETEAVSTISERISIEIEKQKLVGTYTAQITNKEKLVRAYTADRSKLVSAGSEQRAVRHTELAEAVTKVKAELRRLAGQRKTFLALQDEVKDMRDNKAPESLRQVQIRHASSGMNSEEWSNFLLDYKGPVDSNLIGYLEAIELKIAQLKGTPPIVGDPSISYFPEEQDISSLSQAILEAEMARLEKLVSADNETQRRYTALSRSIATETALLQTIKQKLEDAQGASNRVHDLQIQREDAYVRAFDALILEQTVLNDLYAPLMARLASSSGSLRRLSFSVARVANVEQWALEAEEGLIDLRRTGTFRGKGTLFKKASEVLKNAWESGDSETVKAAMSEFRTLYQRELLAHSPVPSSEQSEFRAWLKRFAQWLFSIDHITIQYSINYDGVDIRKLSPGTRGIVLLLLYLALDNSDKRPLIIDQPEENLDPKSVFDELVSLFIEAKAHRQVIIVTHNANLVVNTDADQVIIAESGPNPGGELPNISYKAGGLENFEIRKAVCEILEGGEEAFRERARRQRVRIER